MVRTKLVPKRVKIRQWPPREPYNQFKIKTLLPEQKNSSDPKKRASNKNCHCQKKNKKFYRPLGKNILMEKKLSKKRTGLRPNWDVHDATKCPIINYFADRENTELILLRQEIEIESGCFYCNTCKKCKKLKEYKAELKKKWDFGHLIKMLEHGMFSIQTGK